MAGETNALADMKFPDVSPVNGPVRSSEFGSILDRRCFMKCAAMAGAVCSIDAFARPLTAILPFSGAPAQSDSRFVVEARFYEKLQTARSSASCARANAPLATRSAATAACGRIARRNILHAGALAGVRGAHRSHREEAALPLPAGHAGFSLATAGCNVNCKFCQNWDISQSRPEQVPADYAPPQTVAELAKQYRCPTIAYTYSEPVVFSEYLMDTADAGHAAGVRSIVVSNGYMQQESLQGRRTARWTRSRST
jgi:hypothetical protein